MSDDRLYFRQLLAGRDIARTDPLARQMVNFVYLVGDRETGEAVAIDPAYDIRGILDVLAEDGMRLTGALATHYHPDHVGGSMMGMTISGVRELLMLNPVPIHVQDDEAELVQRVTEVSETDLVRHDSGDKVMVGDIPIELIHTPGHTPGSQCFLVDGRLVAGDTLFLEGCGRTDLPGGDPPSCTAASPPSWPSCPTTPSCSPATCTRRSPRPPWARPSAGTTSSRRRPSPSGWPCSAGRHAPDTSPRRARVA
jgi:glyoxylase-like metal-dependent hydrolase (beta-lactamase superfamily II)